jgi:hypothetical protein
MEGEKEGGGKRGDGHFASPNEVMPPEKSTSITHRALPPFPNPGAVGLLQRSTQARPKSSRVCVEEGALRETTLPRSCRWSDLGRGTRFHPALSLSPASGGERAVASYGAMSPAVLAARGAAAVSGRAVWRRKGASSQEWNIGSERREDSERQ